MKSPIRLVRDVSVSKILKRDVRKWVCDDDQLLAAEFVNRKDSRRTAIIHRSTKPGPLWQASKFDQDGPSGDIREASCTVLLRDFPNRQWRLRSVHGKH